MLSPTSFAEAVDLAPEWRRADVMENVLGLPKTRAGSRVAAVAALAISKTKKGAVSAVEQSERLTYLWMAMNGYYSTLRKLALVHISNRKEYNKLDGELWRLFDNEYLTGYAVPRLWDIIDGNC
jgi:hypothetical protein